MIKVEFLKDYKCCHKKGSVKDVQPHFAKVLIDSGIAKAVSEPRRHKMITKPEKEKME